MLKKILACSVISLFVVFGAISYSLATDAGPAEIEMVGAKSKKPKPAVFPHAAHQKTLKCADCHHGMADGKQVAYTEGQEIGKCESCHNKDVLAGKTKGKLKLDTIKGAGHGNCLECHKEMAAKDEAKKALKSCKTCHPKKK
ncbi:MAG: cytochrome c3 family protein [Desulforhopalus sp.]